MGGGAKKYSCPPTFKSGGASAPATPPSDYASDYCNRNSYDDMVKSPWANELPQLGLEPGARCCKSDALPIELKGYPTSSVLVGRRISIPQHPPPFYWPMFLPVSPSSRRTWARLTRTPRLPPTPLGRTWARVTRTIAFLPQDLGTINPNCRFPSAEPGHD